MAIRRYGVEEETADDGTVIRKKVRVPLEMMDGVDGVSDGVARMLADARRKDRLDRHRPGPRRAYPTTDADDARAKAYDEAGAWMRDAWRTPFVEPQRQQPAQRQQTGDARDARAAAFREQGERLRSAWRNG